MSPPLHAIRNRIEGEKRISRAEALKLATESDFLLLTKLANESAERKNGKRGAFLIDRNINYTNICTARCSFCAFYRPANHREGYTLTHEEIDQKIRETLDAGGTRILMQGGFHPDHTLSTYEDLVSHIRRAHPSIHIHAFSPAEIHYVSAKEKIPYGETIGRLKDAGLGSIPGGGAEILVDRVRNRLMTGKCSASEWLAASRAAHENGVRTTATMMIGHVETWEERIEHLCKIRSLQDETGGFLSFIPWTYQPENTPLHPRAKKNSDVRLASPYEYLRLLAIARLTLDNFDHIQVSLLTQGSKVAQMGLHMGGDDLGSFLIEENVVRSAGCAQEAGLGREQMKKIIAGAGRIPYERDTFYREQRVS